MKNKDISILVVMPEGLPCATVLHWLEEDGYCYCCAENKDEVMKIILSKKIDLVFLDFENDSEMTTLNVRQAFSREELPIVGLYHSENFLVPDGVNEVLRIPLQKDIAKLRLQSQIQMLNLYRENAIGKQTLIESSRMASLGAMAAGVVHEVKNPLTAILGITEIMAEKLEQAEFEKKETITGYASRIKKSADRMSQIIQSVQAYAHEGQGHTPFLPVKISSILEDVRVFSAEKLKETSVELFVEGNENIDIECREVEVSEVLVNLISNACDAVESEAIKEVHIAIKEIDDLIEFSVRDSGSGIPEELRDSLFKELKTTKAKGAGTGLGLYINQMIVNSHNGQIFLDTGSDKTTFIVRLPKKQLVKDVRKKVLVIDDDQDIRMLITMRLEKRGYDVIEAEDGLKAWEILQSEEISIVVTDYRMPNLDGLELAGKLSSLDKRPLVIMVTGYMNELMQQGGDANIDEVVTKPIQWNSFFDIMGKHHDFLN